MRQVLGLLILGLLLAVRQDGAQAQLPPAVLKAQVLVKALHFIEWPNGALAPGQPLQLCVAVESALAQELGRAVGQDLQGHALAVRTVPRGSRWPPGCHVALVGGSVPTDTPSGVLTVSEEAGSLDRGGMLALLVEDGRVVFDIELEVARRAGVGFSARLLRLARFVRKD